MDNNVESLILEHLRAIRTDVAGIKSELKENTQRLGRLEGAVVGLHRDIVHGEEVQVAQELRIDRIVQRIERIETRLELG
jgi:hypothetical protein